MTKYSIIFVSLLLLSLSFASSPNKKESIIRIEVPSHDVVYQLQDRYQLSVINAQNNYIDAYATEDLVKILKNAGYKVKVLIDDYTKVNEKLPLIHTYQQVCSTMVALNQQYPLISKLETLGFSILNRPILIMKVTDNPLIEEDEPEIRIVGPHHGDEKIAEEITLSFLQYLLQNYAFNPAIANLVNNREIWVIPIFNVDGFVANVRYNNAGVDLNRDYGYMWQSGQGSPGPFSQPETRLMFKHAQNNNITLEYEYHSNASYVNYLFDHHPQDPPDSIYLIQISQEYADSTYGSPTTQLTKINGYDWYYVRGSAQDDVFGTWGGIGTTIETPYPTAQAKIDSICIANRRALLSMITRAGWGISGTVQDSLTSQSLFALIKFINPRRWSVYTDKQLGDFHKMVAPGNYTFMVQANGYQPKTFNVTAPLNGVVDTSIILMPDTTNLYYVQKLIWVRRDRPDMAFSTVTMDGLGIPDGVPYSLGPGGTIVLEAVPPIRNFTGNDFTICEAGITQENISVSVSNDWQSGVWYSCGTGNGTTSFDLATASMDSAKYIKIVDGGGGSSSDPYAGYDLDGIAYRREEVSVLEENSAISPMIKMLKIAPNPARANVTIKYQISNIKNPRIKIFNIDGRLVQSINLIPNSMTAVWNTRDMTGKLVPAGIYFCVLDTPQGNFQQKIIINR
jgi:hypothetical protein